MSRSKEMMGRRWGEGEGDKNFVREIELDETKLGR